MEAVLKMFVSILIFYQVLPQWHCSVRIHRIPKVGSQIAVAAAGIVGESSGINQVVVVVDAAAAVGGS
jgi:hypothetical protein